LWIWGLLQKMEGGSEKTTPEGCGGESKSKRKMKTAAQLEVLENTYSGLFLSSSIVFI